MRITFQKELDEGTKVLRTTYDIAFFGQCLDDRGKHSIDLTKSASRLSHLINYVPEDFVLVSGTDRFRADASKAFCAKFPGTSVLLDATTLDVPELLLLCRHYFSDNATKHIGFIYVEPEGYKSKLSASFSPFHPIPGFTPELSSTRVGRLLAFLGFEPTRLHRVLSAEEGSNIKAFSVAFGVPPYRASWEMRAMMPNADVLNEQNAAEDVHYVGANNPLAAYHLIEQTSKTVSDKSERLILAPLGTKPASIGAVLFAALHPNVRIMFDFPLRAADRTFGVGRIHHYGVSPN
jgi:hypothetical protein